MESDVAKLGACTTFHPNSPVPDILFTPLLRPASHFVRFNYLNYLLPELVDMFMFKNRELEVSKCYFTHTDIAIQLDEKNLPTRKVPFSTLGKRPFVHTVRLLQSLHSKKWLTFS